MRRLITWVPNTEVPMEPMLVNLSHVRRDSAIFLTGVLWSRQSYILGWA